jgi:hypothetical protein
MAQILDDERQDVVVFEGMRGESIGDIMSEKQAETCFVLPSHSCTSQVGQRRRTITDKRDLIHLGLN